MKRKVRSGVDPFYNKFLGSERINLRIKWERKLIILVEKIFN